jgi:arginyl-tRNA--protein-N-Asp/Glu arginylyltransferase
MKLLFSEALPDYKNYVFPYAIWAFPEKDETPADFFSRGFLPSSKKLDRFYLCRSLRVALAEFKPSSENRRILRKGNNFRNEIVPRAQFEFTLERKKFCLTYAEQKLGREVMTPERLEQLISAPVTSHLMAFRDAATDLEVGLVTMFLQPPFFAQYYYAFYDLKYARQNLGMFMMTSAVQHLAGLGFHYVYLGSCYSQTALYKTQFTGVEFFNGACWSRNLEELKYLIARSVQPQTQHLFEVDDYIHRFHDGNLGRAVEKSQFRLTA